MAKQYWIGVVHLGMVLPMAEHGFASFSHGKEAAIAKPATGDPFVLYAPKTGMEGDPVQAFVALGEITGDTITERDFPGTDHRCFARAATYATTRQVPVKPMLEDLSFVTNPRYWGMAFRRSLFTVPEADFSRIADAMGNKD